MAEDDEVVELDEELEEELEDDDDEEALLLERLRTFRSGEIYNPIVNNMTLMMLLYDKNFMAPNKQYCVHMLSILNVLLTLFLPLLPRRRRYDGLLWRLR